MGVVALLLAVATTAFSSQYRVLFPGGGAGFTVIRTEAWPAPGTRVMVVAPHPDDETLGGEPVLRAAAANGAPARVVMITCGDAFLRAAEIKFRHTPHHQDMLNFGMLRQQETLHACTAIGLQPDQVVFLGFPDGGVAHLWAENWSPTNLFLSPTTGVDHCPYSDAAVPGAPYCGEALLNEVEDQIRSFQPTDIYVSHAWDDHPDHYATNYFVMAALDALSSDPAVAKIRVHGYLVHCGDLPTPRGYDPRAFVNPPDAIRQDGLTWSELRLTPGEVNFRRQIIDLYHSQVKLTRPFLEGFARSSVLFGDVPAFQPRSVDAVLPTAVDWSRKDAFFSAGRHAGKDDILSEQIVMTPRGVMLRVQSKTLAAGTICHVIIHPLSPVVEGPIMGTTSRPAATIGEDLTESAPVDVIAADTRSINYPGVTRSDFGHTIIMTLPYSLFSNATQAYLDVSLVRRGKPVHGGKWRVVRLPRARQA